MKSQNPTLTLKKIVMVLSRDNRGTFQFSIEDHSSGVPLLRAELSPEAFVNLLSSRQAEVEDAELSLSPHIGKTREVKDLTLTLTSEKDLPREIDIFNAENKEDGWRIDDYQRQWNWHRADNLSGKKIHYQVIAVRYV